MVNGMGEALLDHTGVHFVNGVSKRNWAITGWRSAVLLIACINHNNFAEFPVVRGSAQQETIIVMSMEIFLEWVWKESSCFRREVIWTRSTSSLESTVKFEHCERSVKVWLWGSNGIFDRVWERFRIPSIISNL